MATRNVSPGGALLRASRMFSIPAPLVRPAADLASTTVFNSDTATLPHPTHLAITTLPSSRARGDWGFKRPFPLRSTTKSSTPLIRVNAVDSWEHITEFGSASDHTITLQKWQEMNIPLSTPPSKVRLAGQTYGQTVPGRGVFEDDTDVIMAEPGSKASEDRRWRFDGPWLAGQTEGEFNAYLSAEVKKRKPDFIQHLRTVMAAEDTKNAQRKAIDQGLEDVQKFTPDGYTEAEVTKFIKELRLRDDRRELFGLIRQFLDLAPPPVAKDETVRGFQQDIEDRIGTGEQQVTLTAEDFLGESQSPYANTGPPKTHPSAGLSYLRTSSYIYNHPVFGPQENPAPVESRVVQYRETPVGKFGPKLGVGGIVVDAPHSDTGFHVKAANRSRGNRSALEVDPLKEVNPEIGGGSKYWVRPTTASIDPNGRVILAVGVADPGSLAVHQGTVDGLPAGPKNTVAPAVGFKSPSAGVTGNGYGMSNDSEENPFANKARSTEAERWSDGTAPSVLSRVKPDDAAAMKELESLLGSDSKRSGF